MANNDQNIELVIHLLREQDEKRSIQIKGLHKNMESSFDAFNVKLDAIKDENHALGNLVQKNHDEIAKIKRTIMLWSWVQRNPKKSLVIALVFFMGLLGLLGYLTKEEIESVIKKVLGL